MVKLSVISEVGYCWGGRKAMEDATGSRLNPRHIIISSGEVPRPKRANQHQTTERIWKGTRQ